MCNKKFLKNTEENFIRETENKKIIIFGTSVQMQDAIINFLRPRGLYSRIEYAVDNDFHKWYTNWGGIKIKEPITLKNENSEDVVVLICSQYPFRIEQQLLAYGITNYYSYHLFIEEHIGRYQFMVTF